jgi:succinate-semialdehyde dehydrogenase/glutarate-semialdehyde dehydrogenase
MAMEYRMYIKGEFREAVEGRMLAIVNPATEETIREIPYGGRPEPAEAVAAAAKAFPGWRDFTAHDRARFLFKTAELIRARAEAMARTVTMEVGKPLVESRAEVLATAMQFEWYGEEVKRRWGEWIPAHLPGKRLLTTRMPLGVVAAIAPWNFPLMLMARKVAPALACGCTVVARPASQTPLATMELWNCIHEAGLPAGVANLVTGPPNDGAEEFLHNPLVNNISCSGCSAVGK